MLERIKAEIVDILKILLIGGMLLYALHIVASCVAEGEKADNTIEIKVERALEKEIKKRGLGE